MFRKLALDLVSRELRNVQYKNFNSVRWKSNAYKAAVLKDFNKPLAIEEVSPKDLKPNQVRLAVRYCSLNYTDVKTFQGGSKDLKLPIIPGSEFSGEIIEVGKEVDSEFKVGDKVVALQGHLNEGGGLAEQAIVDQIDCWSLSNISPKNAAILPYGHGTAMLAFTKFSPINENDIVIVIAGPAGLGLGAVEVASGVFKAKVIALCDTEDTGALVRNEGAFQAINMSQGHYDVYKQLKRALGESRAHVIYDAVNQGNLHIFQDFVHPKNGKLISVYPKFSMEKFLSLKPNVEIKKKHKIVTNFEKPIEERIQHVDLYKYRGIDKEFYRQVISDTLEVYEEELISVHISKIFPLEDVDNAIDFILKKKCTGKVLIDLKNSDKSPKKEKDD